VRVPLGWLRDYVDISLSSDEVAERFAQLGFPVESIERRTQLSGVVSGKLVRVEKHPNADRLQVCKVDVGAAELLTIATAATNVAEGQIVPVATIGAQLVGMSIAPREMRGVASQGMLCSAGELGLNADWFEDGILQLDAGSALGADVVAEFRLNDDVLEVEVTANRVDAMSVLGLARELAAATGQPLREPETAVRVAEPADAIVTIETPDCRRFVAQRFSQLHVKTAPFWMQVRLALAGQRPIDNLVDISNFVMLETAQPLHFYDFQRLAGGEIIVRDARPGEILRTLDGAERELDGSELVIADALEAQGLAGVMGGALSEVTSNTRELLLEAATFSGPRVRRMALALGMRTEASSRHEKGLPPGLSSLGAARAAHLLEREGATVHPPIAFGAPLPKPHAIALEFREVPKLLGVDLTGSEVERALRSLGFVVESVQRSSQIDDLSNAIEVAPPYWRNDIAIKEDVIEEVGRVVGYDRIPAVQPPTFVQNVSSKDFHDEHRIAHNLASLGYRETVNFALQPASVAERFARAGIPLPGPAVEIANPLSEDQRYLRFSLLPGLLALAARFARSDELRLFEIGHTFEGAPEPFETAMAAWMLVTPDSAEPEWHDSGFLRHKGDSMALLRALTGRESEAVSAQLTGLHPGRTARLLVDGRDVASAGAVDPRLLAEFEIDAQVYAGFMRLADLPDYQVPRFKAPSRFPAVERDLALVVAKEIPAMDVAHAVREGGDGVLAGVQVFDEYRGPQIEPDKKSIAVRIVLQRDDATLTDAEADAHIRTILATLEERCGARIRA
jgi:phenylalanyl-tRNA synthetase beta chain